jgi:2-C-methyl-D-erythritol 4-phosphate cytidylyltransferase
MKKRMNEAALMQVSKELVAVHDSARPLVTSTDFARCLADGWQVREGAGERASCL